MAAKKVGTLIREARTAKKLSQEQLAAQITGLSGNDIGKAERGEKELTQTQLKAIAKVLGITQKSLLEAPKGGTPATTANTSTAKTSTASKTSTAKSSSAKTPTTSGTAKKTSTEKKPTTAKKTSTEKKPTTAKKTTTAKTSTASKTSSASKTSLTAAEQKFLELYRASDSDNRKVAAKILKGESLDIGDILPMLINPGSTGDDGLLGALLGKLQTMKK